MELFYLRLENAFLDVFGKALVGVLVVRVYFSLDDGTLYHLHAVNNFDFAISSIIE